MTVHLWRAGSRRRRRRSGLGGAGGRLDVCHSGQLIRLSPLLYTEIYLSSPRRGIHWGSAKTLVRDRQVSLPREGGAENLVRTWDPPRGGYGRGVVSTPSPREVVAFTEGRCDIDAKGAGPWCGVGCPGCADSETGLRVALTSAEMLRFLMASELAEFPLRRLLAGLGYQRNQEPRRLASRADSRTSGARRAPVRKR